MEKSVKHIVATMWINRTTSFKGMKRKKLSHKILWRGLIASIFLPVKATLRDFEIMHQLYLTKIHRQSFLKIRYEQYFHIYLCVCVALKVKA